MCSIHDVMAKQIQFWMTSRTFGSVIVYLCMLFILELTYTGDSTGQFKDNKLTLVIVVQLTQN